MSIMPHDTKEKRAAYIKKYNHDRVEKGLCAFCGKPRGEDGSKWMCRQCCDRTNASSREYTQQLKKEVILHYGGKCVCCGESNLGFLTIDHTNNDGKEHRKSMGRKDWGGKELYKWLKKHNYPEGYRVQCFNCNLGRSINNGVCPHQVTKNPKF